MTSLPPNADDSSDAVEKALLDLAQRVAAGHDRAAHREQVIDRLHAENLELRRGLLQEALTPVRAGLYRLYDRVSREAARDQDPLLTAIAEDVVEVLARTGAERIEVAAGDPYDSVRHKPVRTAEGPDGTVIEVESDGFALGERVLRKAGVVVGRRVGKQSETEETS